MNELTRENSNRIGDAAALLGDFDDPRAVETLIELLLNDKNDNVRVSSAYALSKLKSPRSFDAFLKALNDPHATTRQWAVIGLMRLKDKRAIEHLNKVLMDENALVRRSAQDAIKYIENQ